MTSATIKYILTYLLNPVLFYRAVSRAIKYIKQRKLCFPNNAEQSYWAWTLFFRFFSASDIVFSFSEKSWLKTWNYHGYFSTETIRKSHISEVLEKLYRISSLILGTCRNENFSSGIHLHTIISVHGKLSWYLIIL